jgi:hypothetical protein
VRLVQLRYWSGRRYKFDAQVVESLVGGLIEGLKTEIQVWYRGSRRETDNLYTGLVDPIGKLLGV